MVDLAVVHAVTAKEVARPVDPWGHAWRAGLCILKIAAAHGRCMTPACPPRPWPQVDLALQLLTDLAGRRPGDAAVLSKLGRVHLQFGWRGMRARVTIGRLRRSSLRTVRQHRAPTDAPSNQRNVAAAEDAFHIYYGKMLRSNLFK